MAANTSVCSILITSSENPPNFHWQRCGQINHNIILWCLPHNSEIGRTTPWGRVSQSWREADTENTRPRTAKSNDWKKEFWGSCCHFTWETNSCRHLVKSNYLYTFPYQKKRFYAILNIFSHCSWAEFISSHLHHTRKPYPHSCKTGISVFRVML